MTLNRKEFGDYQTPLFFTEKICNYLKNVLKINARTIIEPTCGIGNFLKSASNYFPNANLYGIEINKNHIKKIDSTIPKLKIFNENIFEFDFNNIEHSSQYLILGNPPWITNSELSKLNLKNFSKKFNFKKEIGLNALMGHSNFDISENIIMCFIKEFMNKNSTIAFLCKTTVAMNIFRELKRNNILYSNISILRFNAKKVFNVSISACLFILQFGHETEKTDFCNVYDFENPSKIVDKFDYFNGNFYSNLNNYCEIDGKCCMEWRQGVKHDCSSIMELTKHNDNYKNNNGDIFSLENDYIYPLLKSSDLKVPIITNTRKQVIITQKNVGDNTNVIKKTAPKTWDYLNFNKKFFDKRKSFIYNNMPEFSIFGIGDYSFMKYKVAVSGFYKNPLFSLVYGEKPVMLDDTCYFISFNNYDEAYITMLILNSDLVQNFLKSIAFLDSKRPFNKKILKRIDIQKSLDKLTLNNLINTEYKLNLCPYVDEINFKEYMDKYG